MISTDFKGDPVFIINDAWSSDEFKLDASLMRDDQESLTKRSARRPYSQTLVCQCQYQVTLRDAEVRSVLGSLRSLSTQKVIVPLWPAITTWAARGDSTVTGGLRLAFKEDWSQYELYAFGDADPVWPLASDLWLPALMGFINPTQPRMRSPDAATWDIDFQESSPAEYALRFLEDLQDVAGNAFRDPAGKTLKGF